MIRATNLSFTYNSKVIYDQTSFTVNRGSKVGLVGQNGTGKSTLFKLLTKQEQLDDGQIDIGGELQMVPQEVKHDPVLATSETIHAYLDSEGRLMEYEIMTMLVGVELDELNLTAKPEGLSGGQKTKLALVKAMLAEPDILLLDEPTNFLDTAGKRWVMHFLSQYPKTLVMVSHDLKLLDAQIDKVLAVNPHTRKIDEYAGNYSQYQRLKAEREEHLKRQIKSQMQQIKRMEKGLQKIQGVQSEKGVRQKINLQNRIRRAEESLPAMPPKLRRFSITLPSPAPIGEVPVKVEAVSKIYGDLRVLDRFGCSFYRGERVAMIGPNGAGKSTLIKIMLGSVQPDAGQVVWDEQAKVGYYSQELDTLDMEQTLLQTLQAKCVGHEQTLRSFLGRFMFSGDMIYQSIKTLSGGEKTRLAIALLVTQDFNVLILDEPTTYLDPLSQRIILEAIKEYRGTLLVVSHTEDFIRELKPDRAILMPEQQVDYWKNEYLERVADL